MHELSIAIAIVDAAAEQAQRESGRVIAVHLRLGPLSGVVKEALLASYDLAAEGSPVEGSKLLVQDMPIIVWCPACARETQLDSPQQLCCPTCGTPTPDVRAGRELQVFALEVCDANDSTGRSPAASAQAK
jgi:hydrogenase nickel incorporation protein HypA/HybF